MKPESPWPTIIFRADGSHEIGLGHLVRAASIAAMCSRSCTCVLAHRGLPEGMGDMALRYFDRELNLRQPGSIDLEREVTDLVAAATEGASGTNHPVVVLDGYEFDVDYQDALTERGVRVVCVDDVHRGRFSAHVVINHAPGIANRYDGLVSPGRLLSGLRYAILRPEFLAKARDPLSPYAATSKRTYVSFGGADKFGLSLAYARALLDGDPEREVVLTCGAAFRQRSEARLLAARESRLSVHESVGADALVDILGACGSAVVPASTTLYEITAMRVPVVSGHFVDNQLAIYRGFLDAGLIYGLGELRAGTQHLNEAVAAVEREADTYRQRQRRSIDGMSGSRLRAVIGALIEGSTTTPLSGEAVQRQ